MLRLTQAHEKLRKLKSAVTACSTAYAIADTINEWLSPGSEKRLNVRSFIKIGRMVRTAELVGRNISALTGYQQKQTGDGKARKAHNCESTVEVTGTQSNFIRQRLAEACDFPYLN